MKLRHVYRLYGGQSTQGQGVMEHPSFNTTVLQSCYILHIGSSFPLLIIGSSAGNLSATTKSCDNQPEFVSSDPSINLGT